MYPDRLYPDRDSAIADLQREVAKLRAEVDLLNGSWERKVDSYSARRSAYLQVAGRLVEVGRLNANTMTLRKCPKGHWTTLRQEGTLVIFVDDDIEEHSILLPGGIHDGEIHYTTCAETD